MLEQMSPQLKSLAYRMLGSAADAEDIVQEAWLRLHQTEPKPDSEQAFLYRVVSNLCVDRLRRLKVERRHYFGPWLPDPIADASLNLEEAAIADQDLSNGFMLLMENLSPAERIVYVLRQAFDFSYQEISQLLQISPACARQRAHRAQRRVTASRDSGVNASPATATDARPESFSEAVRDGQKSMLAELSARIAAGDINGLIHLMSEDVVALTDGGGVVSAAIIPVEGRQRIAQMSVFLANKNAGQGVSEVRYVAVNGGWGMVSLRQGVIDSCIQIEVADDLVRRIYVMRNPGKLVHLSQALGLSAPAPG